jgi:Uncharacterised nucleotidyltransferase
MQDALPREFLLVAAAALARDEELGARVRALAQTGLDWQAVEAQARYHAVLGMLGARIDRLVPGLLPDWLSTAARRELTGNLALQTAQAHHTMALVEQLAQRGVRVIVLKGVPLAHTIYPSAPQWRYIGDIDLLIDPADIAAADAVLRAAGHQRTSPDAAMLASLGHGLFARFAKDYTYLSDDGAHHIELHFRLKDNPHAFAIGFDALFANSVAIDTGFGPVRALRGPVQLAYLASHALANVIHPIKWIADAVWMRRLLEAQGAISDPAAPVAPRCGRAVALVGEIEAIVLGGSALTSGSADARWVCRGMAAMHLHPPGRTFRSLPQEARTIMLDMRLTDSTRGKAWRLWRTLTNPRDAMALGGRDWPGWIYAFAGPGLSLGRYARRLLARAR